MMRSTKTPRDRTCQQVKSLKTKRSRKSRRLFTNTLPHPDLCPNRPAKERPRGLCQNIFMKKLLQVWQRRSDTGERKNKKLWTLSMTKEKLEEMWRSSQRQRRQHLAWPALPLACLGGWQRGNFGFHQYSHISSPGSTGRRIRRARPSFQRRRRETAGLERGKVSHESCGLFVQILFCSILHLVE